MITKSKFPFITLLLHKILTKNCIKDLRNPMDKGYKDFNYKIKTISRRSPQVKSSKAQIQAKYHKIPAIRFEDQKLTSFSGLLIFQVLFRRLNLKQRLYQCFPNGKVSPIFGRHLVVLLLIVHLIVGFRRLREVDYYRDDPLVLRLMGLRKLPDVSTISRALSQMESEEVEKIRELLGKNPKKKTLHLLLLLLLEIILKKTLKT